MPATVHNRMSARGVNRGPRLSAVLMGSERKNFGSIVSLPSNAQAVESALLFANGQTPFVALIGPSGCGKSHLIDAAARQIHLLDPNNRAQVVNAKEWPMVCSRIDPRLPLLVDNAQEGMSHHRSRLQLQMALERRVKSGRPTLLAFTAIRPSRALRAFLPNHHMWLLATIEQPSTAERIELVGQLADAAGLTICDCLQRTLAIHLQGSGRTLEGAFKRLRLQDNRWVDAHACLRALGLLNPFFADSSDWDLREVIAEACCSSTGPVECDRAIYVMLRVAYLAEADVAQYFEIEPSLAYSQAVRFQKRLDEEADQRLLTRQAVDRIVSGLAHKPNP